jgi:CheY-like chemotaxis protein
MSLASAGFEAIEASDCEQAFRQAWESHPDIVVTDLTLRGADGWQLVQDLKREARTRDIPVVLLTGHGAPALRERAEREGCAAFFVKPCLPDALAAELRQAYELYCDRGREDGHDVDDWLNAERELHDGASSSAA